MIDYIKGNNIIVFCLSLLVGFVGGIMLTFGDYKDAESNRYESKMLCSSTVDNFKFEMSEYNRYLRLGIYVDGESTPLYKGTIYPDEADYLAGRVPNGPVQPRNDICDFEVEAINGDTLLGKGFLYLSEQHEIIDVLPWSYKTNQRSEEISEQYRDQNNRYFQVKGLEWVEFRPGEVVAVHRVDALEAGRVIDTFSIIMSKEFSSSSNWELVEFK
jgi:hypothetical protein